MKPLKKGGMFTRTTRMRMAAGRHDTLAGSFPYLNNDLDWLKLHIASSFIKD